MKTRKSGKNVGAQVGEFKSIIHSLCTENVELRQALIQQEQHQEEEDTKKVVS